MGKMFMLLTALCLFSASLFAEPIEQQAQQDSAKTQAQLAETYFKQIASIGNYGRLKVQTGVLPIVQVTPSKRTNGGVSILTMDSNHTRFRTFFWGSWLKERKVDKFKFAKALKDPNTVVDCRLSAPRFLGDMIDYIPCRKDFVVHSNLSIGQ